MSSGAPPGHGRLGGGGFLNVLGIIYLVKIIRPTGRADLSPPGDRRARMHAAQRLTGPAA